jgi:hypothetical protein
MLYSALLNLYYHFTLSDSGQTDMGRHFIKMFTAMPYFNLAIQAFSKSTCFRPYLGRQFIFTLHEFPAILCPLTHVLMAKHRRPFCPALHLTLHVFSAVSWPPHNFHNPRVSGRIYATILSCTPSHTPRVSGRI